MSDDNYHKPSRRKFIFAYPVYLHGVRVKFVYEGHGVKVNRQGNKSNKFKNPYFRNVTLRSPMTPVL